MIRMAGEGANAEPEEEISSSSSSIGWDSEKRGTSDDEGRAKCKNKFLPDGFLDPLPPQKSSKLPRFSGGSLLGRAKKVIYRGGSSSRECSRANKSYSTPVLLDSEEHDSNGHQVSQQHSFHNQGQPAHQPNDGIWLIDDQGVPIRRRGHTTCADIQSMSPGIRVHIEVNDKGIPNNIPESILLGSYLGVIARDPVLAPISFSDWRNKGMEQFKKKILIEVEAKFEFPGYIRPWILQSIGVKWRNHKNNLKAEYWDNRPIEEIMEVVPTGVDMIQWCQLVTQWSRPRDQERATKNRDNAKKQTCPHTMGRISSVRRQQETAIKDRLQLWRINRIHKDGSWSSDDARLRWVHACELLAEEGLTPDDGNVEANEKVFLKIMGPEHPGRVRTQGFGATPTRFFPHNSDTTGEGSGGNNFGRIARLEEDVSSLRTEMREFMQHLQSQYPPPSRSYMGGNE